MIKGLKASKLREKMMSEKKILNIVLSFCSSIALCMNFRAPNMEPKYRDNFVAEVFLNLKISMNSKSFVATILFISLFLLYEKKSDKCTMGIDIISMLIAIVWLFGASFSIDNTMYPIVSSLGQGAKAVIYLVGMTSLIRVLAIVVHDFIHGLKDEPWKGLSIKKAFFMIIICWIPHIIICYPGYVCPDAWNQLSQYFGLSNFTTHHPPAHTLLMGMIVKIGTNLGNGEIGLFIFVLFQLFFFALVISYSICETNKICMNKYITIGMLAVFIVFPYSAGYVGLLLKDNLYSCMFLLFMVEFLKFVNNHYEFKGIKSTVLWIVSVMGVILFRNNGKYVIYPLVMVLFIILIKQYKLKKRKKVLGVLLTPIVLAVTINTVLISSYNIEKGSIREALSLPFQQTARYVKYYEDELDESEIRIINNVLDYEHMAQNYNPILSDHIKNDYKESATKEELKEYLTLWIKQFFKHPMIYVEATINQNYFLLYPFYENDVVYNETYVDEKRFIHTELPTFSEESNKEHLEKWKNAEYGYMKLLFSLPVIGLFSHPATYVLVLIFLLYYSLKDKNKRFLLLVSPLLLSIVVIILAPCIQNHPRYAFPIIYSFPVILGYYYSCMKRIPRTEE